ncbi:MAG: glycosyltransferase family 61 protein [Alphaproteobacteria bacterium]|nr:glycosyltransferase family 61 protein [Alphaproteobacteria bacterium]
MAARKLGSRNFRWLALKTATRVLPSLRRRYPLYEKVVPLLDAGHVQIVTEQQPLLLSPEEQAYAKRFEPPLPEVVERSIALVRLEGAAVLGNTGAVIDEERGVLYQSRYTADRYGTGASYHDFVDLPSARVDKPEANYFSMVGEYRGHQHFFHFLFDRLPRIFYLLSRFDMGDKPFVVLTNQELPEFQQDIYRFLAERYPNLTFVAVPEGERWRLPLLFLIDDMQPVRRSFLPPDALEFFRDLIIRGYGLSAVPPRRRLYINRSDARKRWIRNEAEIWPSFASRGFESIAAGKLLFRDQVALFAEAEIIAGPHGAGFSNLLFAPHRAKVLEISNVERVKSVYFLLAKGMNQHYVPLIGGRGDRNERFQVDPAAVEAALQKMDAASSN